MSTTVYQEAYYHFGLIESDVDDSKFVDCAVAAEPNILSPMISIYLRRNSIISNNYCKMEEMVALFLPFLIDINYLRHGN